MSSTIPVGGGVRPTRPVVCALLTWLGLALGGCSEGGDTRWRPAFEAEPIGWLYAAWGSAPDDVYVVGAKGEVLEGVVMHHDGAEWTELDLDVSIPLLYWVHGRSATDVTFVGARGTIVHWDGAEANVQSAGTRAPLWGVWGATSNDVWAVGGGAFEGDEPVLLHFDGSDWAQVALPELADPDVHALFKVWGSAADDVYAVGQRGVVLHYDGDAWTELESETDADLISVWGTGPDRVVMVGGRDNGVVLMRESGDALRSVSLPEGVPGLNGVWLGEGTTVHVVGAQGVHLEIPPDGDGEVTVDFAPTDGDDLHGVFGVGNDLYSVGGNLLASSPPFRGVALHRNIRR